MQIDWANVFVKRFFWVDLLVFALPSFVHLISWLATPRSFPDDVESRRNGAESFRSTAIGGITAVGILIPVTLLAIQLGTSNTSSIPASSMLDVFLADLWFTLSLFFGLYVLWVVAVKSGSKNAYNLPDVGISYGLQLTALLTGVVRLVIGIAGVVNGRS
jgi:hypothetical protein